ncbi:hypothetical protein IQ235_01330 [Oscillatoriales cyanobacterium LEGE 11467]|uniref:Uncharacterized protein n=1 Tax=Zarconia navalis LEGE 11467 TaxID=1828826 RepID=A0A928VUA0_9CYAN|nr:hypothetical protein [Zarconia navalis]MBE9039438.1 hypothetical protein [Zarconia navalis LEGE 11467]
MRAGVAGGAGIAGGNPPTPGFLPNIGASTNQLPQTVVTTHGCLPPTMS